MSGTAPAPRETPTLLALRALGLGDVLTGVPALRGLRRRFPDHRLVLACPTGLAPVVALTGAVDEVLAVAAFRLDPLPPLPPPELAVNLHGKGPRSTGVLAAVAPGRLVAFGEPGCPSWRDDEREVDRWCRLVASCGAPADPDDLEIDRPGVEPPVRGAVIVHPGAASEAKRWPAERFAEVARACAAAGAPVVVTGSGAEVALARSVARSAGLAERAVLAGRTGLSDLAALVSSARVVVSNDTGVAHLAVAYGTPSVTVFGPVSPAVWGPPPGRPQHRAVWSGVPGDPHGPVVDPALASLPCTEVLDEVDRAIAARPVVTASSGPSLPAGQRPARTEPA